MIQVYVSRTDHMCTTPVTSPVLYPAGTPGNEGAPITPSSTPRASTTSTTTTTAEETRQIKTEPENHSLYTHHSSHAQVRHLNGEISKDIYVQEIYDKLRFLVDISVKINASLTTCHSEQKDGKNSTSHHLLHYLSRFLLCQPTWQLKEAPFP